MPEIIRQHLIDPIACTRCNTCADTCPSAAISYKKNRYIVDPVVCNGCGDCIEDCPSGAIDHWRMVPADEVYSLAQQIAWPELAAADPELGGDDGGSGAILFPPSAPALARVVSVTSLVGAGATQDIRHIVLDLGDTPFPFVEGQSVGIFPPCPAGDEQPALRLYSIANAHRGEGEGANRVTLAVKRVTHDHDGNAYAGLCSTYLCALAAGDDVGVVGPYGTHFLMPADDVAPLLWIATGTGISPARAMIEKRLTTATAGAGPIHLYYGARTPADMAFHDDLAGLGAAIGFRPAFSRDPGQPKTYVQDTLRQNTAEVIALLDHPDARIFMCGLKGMEAGVFAALTEICAATTKPWDKRAAEMAAEHRLLIETY